MTAAERDEQGRLIERDTIFERFRKTGPSYCSGCGRLMVETTEKNGFDAKTGEQMYRVWVSCPRHFMSLLRNLLTLGTGGMGHDSFARDMPMLARRWQ